MNKIKLTNIFEGIVNQYGVDLSQAPHLVGLMGRIKPNASGAKVVTDADFKSLLNGKNRAVQNVLMYISTGNDSQKYADTTPLGRIYNLFKFVSYNVKTGKLPTQHIPMYKGALDELVAIANEIKLSNNKKSVQSLNTTTYLKNYNTFKDTNGQEITIEDVDLEAFVDKSDPHVNAFYNAILSADFSLSKVDTTPAGLVYAWYNTLYTRCKSTMVSYASLMDKMASAKMVKKDGTVGNQSAPLASVKSLNVDTTQDRVDMELTYRLYTQKNKPFRNSNTPYSGLYTYYDKKWTYQFINNRDKNNSMQFTKPVPKGHIYLNQLYNISYGDEKTTGMEDLRIEFIEIKTGSKGQDFSEFVFCNALKELTDILKNIRA